MLMTSELARGVETKASGLLPRDLIVELIPVGSKFLAKARQAYDWSRDALLEGLLPNPGFVEVDQGLYTGWYVAIPAQGDYRPKIWGGEYKYRQSSSFASVNPRQVDQFFRFPDEINFEYWQQRVKRGQLMGKDVYELRGLRADFAELPDFLAMGELGAEEFWKLYTTELEAHEKEYNYLRATSNTQALAEFGRVRLLWLAMLNEQNRLLFETLIGEMKDYLTQEGTTFCQLGNGVAWVVKYTDDVGETRARVLPFPGLSPDEVSNFLQNGIDEEVINYEELAARYQSRWPRSRLFNGRYSLAER